MSITFEVIPLLSDFDAEVRQYHGVSIFSQKPWLQFSLDNAGGKFIGVRIKEGVTHNSYFAGVFFRKFGISFIGIILYNFLSFC